MPKLSAGILLYRRAASGLEVFLVHPGGPLWRDKDAGAWSIPKGEYGPEEEPLAAALREFEEETGVPLDDGGFHPLGNITQKSGKVVSAWAREGNLDAGSIRSNTFSMEWPPRSGRMQEFPEVDHAGWFSLEGARTRLIESQHPLLDRLAEAVGKSG